MKKDKNIKNKTKTPSLELGELIKYYREKKNLTLAELSKKVGVSYIHLSYLEKGERVPSEELLRELAKIFADSPEEEIKLRHKMFFYLTQIKAPLEIVEMIELHDNLKEKNVYMPEPFLIILKNTIEKKTLT
ncbi:MAG: helix-turn-helix transcriptional regulator [Candidatus Micrarchaeia archaeon]